MAFSLLTAEKSELAPLFSQKGPVVYELRHLRIETGDKRFQDGTYLVDAGNPANREIKIFFHKLLPAAELNIPKRKLNQRPLIQVN